jgi:hypothetical protein
MEPPNSVAANASPPETIPGTLHLFGFPDVPAQVTIVRHDAGARMRRALVALGACWGLGLVSVLVPIAHFVLVPGFFVLGIVLATTRARETASVLGAAGHCPRCDAERAFVASGRLREESMAQCPVCRNELSLTIESALVRGAR